MRVVERPLRPVVADCPTLLSSLLDSTDRTRAQQALDAMMTMDKLDIAALQAAYDR